MVGFTDGFTDADIVENGLKKIQSSVVLREDYCVLNAIIKLELNHQSLGEIG